MASQWRAGPDCLAVLDTCAGELDPAAFNRWVVPQLRAPAARSSVGCVPMARVLYYSKGTDARHWRLLERLPIAGIGIDWRTPVAAALDGIRRSLGRPGQFRSARVAAARNGFPLLRDVDVDPAVLAATEEQ